MVGSFKSAYDLLLLAASVTLANYLLIWHGQHAADLPQFAGVLICLLLLLHVCMHRHSSGRQPSSKGDDDGNKVRNRTSLE